MKMNPGMRMLVLGVVICAASGVGPQKASDDAKTGADGKSVSAGTLTIA